jgi:hypothetical protein
VRDRDQCGAPAFGSSDLVDDPCAHAGEEIVGRDGMIADHERHIVADIVRELADESPRSRHAHLFGGVAEEQCAVFVDEHGG